MPDKPISQALSCYKLDFSNLPAKDFPFSGQNYTPKQRLYITSFPFRSLEMT